MKAVTLTRLNLIALILFSTFFVLVRNIYLISLIFCILIAINGVIKHRGNVKSRLVAIIGVSALVILFQLIVNSTVPIYERLLIGSLTTLRLVSLSLLVFIFTETTSPSSIVSALSFLPNNVTLMLTISFSLIPAILQEVSAIRIAQQARGAHSGSIIPVLVPLLNRTLTRAEHIAIVLQTRGFE
jgi:energy-coupling factor transporter transmembrane protein EcfT